MARLDEIRNRVEWDYNTVVVDLAQRDQVARDRALACSDLVVFDTAPVVIERIGDQLIRAQASGKRVENFVRFYSAYTGRIPHELVDDQWLLYHYRAMFGRVTYRTVRRIVDISVGTLLIIVFAIIGALAALAIYLTSPGGVLYRQERLGQFTYPFVLYKLRTMFADAERERPSWAKPNDPRRTAVGRFLRASHLDEIPQLVNVVRGDMSLIGPRPIRAYFAQILAEEIPGYNIRFLIKPGLTGWSQVLGAHGSTIAEQRVNQELDLYYVLNASPLLDVYILVKTVQVMVLGRGV